MADKTTQMRDEWVAHFEEATDKMAEAVNELTAAARHLEPPFRSRVITIRRHLEALAGRALNSQRKLTRDRSAAAAAAAR